MGRPAQASNSMDRFEDSIQCYWAKFPFNTCLHLVLEEIPRTSRAVNVLLREFTFIGPAPRYFLAECRGNVKDSNLYKDTRRLLTIVDRSIAEKFGVQHSLYGVQINPCDLCHFCTMMRPDRQKDETFHPSNPAMSVRGGAISAARMQLLSIFDLEERIGKHNLADFAPSTIDGMLHFSAKWADLDVGQRSWLSRFADTLGEEGLKALKDSVRKVKGRWLVWCQDATGSRLVIVAR
jgi:hypothetical protein